MKKALALSAILSLSCMNLLGCGGAPTPQAAVGAIPSAQRAPIDIPRVASRPLMSPAHLPNAAPRQLLTTSQTSVDAKVLVVAGDGNEADLPLITQTLDYLGTPYTLWVAADHPGGLTASMLSNADHGYYQAVMLTTGGLSIDRNGQWASALSDAEWQALWQYEAAFGVRQVTWYTYPTPDYGFGAATAQSTDATPLVCTLTDAGRKTFGYLNPDAQIAISHAYTYLAKPTAGTVPLLTDAAGDAIAAVHTSADGRENLALTCDGNNFLVHSEALAYGVVNWATRGLFLGERQVYLDPETDDVFIDDDLYTGGTYRITGDDLKALDRWQKGIQKDPLLHGFAVTLPFNGQGTEKGAYTPDTLTPAAKKLQGDFKWLNHTYTHLNLDAASYADTQQELTQNDQVAKKMHFKRFATDDMVCPDVSGLKNPQAMQAAYDVGIRFLVSDTSYADQDNPSPNAGIPNVCVPGILEVPRRPTNLFYNVTTPDQWVAEYNALYRSYWGRDLSYAEILDKESDVFIWRYLLRGEVDPWMFHQSNLRAYDGTHSLLGDLLDETFKKYEALYTLPIQSPRLDELGQLMAARMAYNAANVQATIVPGVSITLHADKACDVPVTGLAGPHALSYGGQSIGLVSLQAGQTVTLPLK